MAGSRKSPQRRKTAAAPANALAQALRQALGSSADCAGPNAAIVLAYSGGRDSTALLDLACDLRDEGFAPARSLVAVHVHHGLHPQADAWAQHCRVHCERRGLAFEWVHVAVRRRGRGVEAAAREARYGALLEMAQALGARAVCTAHHLDDRIETFLLQWLRGAGVAGLSAFSFERALGQGVRLLRPFAQTRRSVLEAYCAGRGLAFIDDPSNADEAYARSALRQHVMPALERVRPDFHKTTARSIELIAEASEVLESIASSDFALCAVDGEAGALRLDALRALSEGRQRGVLRYWLGQRGLQAPGRARLAELLRQALDARADAKMCFRLGPVQLYRYRDRLWLAAATLAPPAQTVVLSWRGEPWLDVPAWGGRLYFDRAEEGFEAQWLQAGPLTLGARAGGERLKLHPRRPSKTLKAWFQEAAVPEPARGFLPLLWCQEKLIFAAGLGVDARFLGRGGDRTAPRWQALQPSPETINFL